MMKCLFIVLFLSPEPICISHLYLAIFAVPNNLSLATISMYILLFFRSLTQLLVQNRHNMATHVFPPGFLTSENVFFFFAAFDSACSIFHLMCIVATQYSSHKTQYQIRKPYTSSTFRLHRTKSRAWIANLEKQLYQFTQGIVGLIPTD